MPEIQWAPAIAMKSISWPAKKQKSLTAKNVEPSSVPWDMFTVMQISGPQNLASTSECPEWMTWLKRLGRSPSDTIVQIGHTFGLSEL